VISCSDISINILFFVLLTTFSSTEQYLGEGRIFDTIALNAGNQTSVVIPNKSVSFWDKQSNIVGVTSVSMAMLKKADESFLEYLLCM
jgi:D-lyxose ketol-isomerase